MTETPTPGRRVTDPSKYEWTHVRRATSVSICAPPCRMFWIQAGACDGDEPDQVWCHVHPILAIQSLISDTFCIRKQKGHPPTEYREPQHLEEGGWQFSDHTIEQSFVVYDEEYGPTSTDDSLMRDTNSYTEVCFCPWPFDQDRDEAVIEKAARIAKDRVRKHLKLMVKEKTENPPAT